MGKIKLISVAAASVFALNACDIGGGKVACSEENGIQALRSLVGEEIEKSLKNQGLFDLANIRASIAALPMSFEEIRTSKEDPNSTKVFCQATFRVTPSVDMVKDAETIDKIMPKVMEFIGDSILVAHNADFDIGFIRYNAELLRI